MEKFLDEYLVAAHKLSTRNEDHLKKSEICGCFQCLNVFSPSLISWWFEEKPLTSARLKPQRTGFCPICQIDSILGDASGYPINKDFLQAMKNYYF